MGDVYLNIRHGGSSLVSLSQSTATTTTSTSSTFAMSSDQTGTLRSPLGEGEVGQLELPMFSRLSLTTKMEGTTPLIFDGTNGEARRWFNKVELHFFVNQQSTAAKDVLQKIGLTLGWIRGSRVDYWVD